MGGNWISDILTERMESDEEQSEYKIRFTNECKSILTGCPLFIERLEQMLTEQDEKVDILSGDELLKAIGARAQIKNIYGNIRHWADVKPEMEGE